MKRSPRSRHSSVRRRVSAKCELPASMTMSSSSSSGARSPITPSTGAPALTITMIRRGRSSAETNSSSDSAAVNGAFVAVLGHELAASCSRSGCGRRSATPRRAMFRARFAPITASPVTPIWLMRRTLQGEPRAFDERLELAVRASRAGGTSCRSRARRSGRFVCGNARRIRSATVSGVSTSSVERSSTPRMIVFAGSASSTRQIEPGLRGLDAHLVAVGLGQLGQERVALGPLVDDRGVAEADVDGATSPAARRWRA